MHIVDDALELERAPCPAAFSGGDALPIGGAGGGARRGAGDPAVAERDDAGAPAPWIGPFVLGEVLGETYEITGILGAGGMGVVYEARDLRLGRAVAVKVPLRDDYAQGLRQEAQAMAAVHHPNLVTLYAMGRHAGVDYLVMERVFGMTLEDRVEEAAASGSPVGLEEALAILTAVTDALGAIHGAGMAHRDIKAANVLLSGGRVVVTDFGLMTPEVALRGYQQIAGSADYMAPELILGAVRPGDGPLVDLYALGVVGFELLAGRRPFAAERIQTVLAFHLEKPVPDVRERRRDVPEDLARLLRELMAKTPHDRPETSDAVLWRLAAIRAAFEAAPEPVPMSVLVVDDEADVGAMLKSNLQWSLPHLAVDAVTSAELALARADRHAPDVVVVDLDMPGTNGIELCMALRAFPERTRPVIVAMGGDLSGGDVALLRSLGVDELVPKDHRFVAGVCDVISELRHARQEPRSGRPRRSARPRT